MNINDLNQRRRTTLILALICCVAQVAISPHIALGGGHINFMLIFAAVLALMWGGGFGMVAGFLAGLFYDLVTTGPIGLMAGLLTVATFVLGLEERNRLSDDTMRALRLFCYTAAGVEALYQIGLAISGAGAGFFAVIFTRWLPSTVLDCIVFLPFCFVLAQTATPIPKLGKKKSGRKARKGSLKRLR